MSSSAESSKSGQSDDVPNTTKLEIRRLCGEDCWACSRIPGHIRRVVKQDDGQVGLWRQKGLINLSLDSINNAILLCTECHPNYESLRFVFIPYDIQFFIDFGRQGYERRRHEVETSEILPQREVPTPEMYRAYQNGLIGGRYQRVFVKESPHLGSDLEELSTTPKEWPGCLIIVFRRAFQMFSSLYLDSLGIETRLHLEELLNLYVTDNNELRASCRGCQEETAEEQYANYYQHSTNIPEDPNSLGHGNAS